MIKLIQKLFFITVSVMLIGCSSSQQSHPKSQSGGGTGGVYESGKASYYADKYQSRQTANGERFDQRKLTAAHKTLPFGTWVRVINLDNGRSVNVRINDRGPFVKGRIIDLSRSAFSAIGNTRSGLLNVRVQILR